MSRRYYTQNVFTPYGWTIPQTSNPMELWPYAQRYYAQYGNGQYGAQYSRFGRSGGGVPFGPRLPRCQSGTCPPYAPPGLIMTTRSGPEEFAILRDLANLCTVTPQQPLPYRDPILSPGCPPAPSPPPNPGATGTCWGAPPVGTPIPGPTPSSTPTISTPGLTPPRRPERPGQPPVTPGIDLGPTMTPGIDRTTTPGGRTPRPSPASPVTQLAAPVPSSSPIPTTRAGNPRHSNPSQGTIRMQNRPKEWSALNFGKRAAKWTRATGSNGGCTSCRIKADPAGFTTGISVGKRRKKRTPEQELRRLKAKARARASSRNVKLAAKRAFERAAQESARASNMPPMARFGRVPNMPPMARFGRVPHGRVANVPRIHFARPEVATHVGSPVSPFYSKRAGRMTSPAWQAATGSSRMFLRPTAPTSWRPQGGRGPSELPGPSSRPGGPIPQPIPTPGWRPQGGRGPSELPEPASRPGKPTPRPISGRLPIGYFRRR